MCLRYNFTDVLSFYTRWNVLLVCAAVARVIKYGEHKVYGEVVSVQNACAEDLIDFTGNYCNIFKSKYSQQMTKQTVDKLAL
jgi:hypothetical protein